MIIGAIVLVIVGVLVANYFKDKNVGTIPENGNQTSATSEHTVIKGETLWSIAEDSYGSGYNWTDIKNANNLKTEAIDVGQKLVIPNDVEAKEPTTTVKDLTVNQGITIDGDSYTVEKGDNLWDIAVRAYGDGYMWTKIAEANSLENPDIIHSGNVLILPR